MNVKKIDPKLYKAIMMAYQYQINCELTPSQCKELIDYIYNPLEVEEVCEWKGVRYNPPGLPVYYAYYPPHDVSYCVSTYQVEEYLFCPDCGKRIVYKEGE